MNWNFKQHRDRGLLSFHVSHLSPHMLKTWKHFEWLTTNQQYNSWFNELNPRLKKMIESFDGKAVLMSHDMLKHFYGHDHMLVSLNLNATHSSLSKCKNTSNISVEKLVSTALEPWMNLIVFRTASYLYILLLLLLHLIDLLQRERKAAIIGPTWILGGRSIYT